MRNSLTGTKHLAAFVFSLLLLCSARSFGITVGCPDNGAYPWNGCSLPGLVDGSFPFFYQEIKVRYIHSKHRDKFIVKAHYRKRSPGSSLHVDPEDVLGITKTRLKFKAKVIDGVATGKIKIKGRIDALGIKGTLMTAELKGAWAADGTLIGFNTKNIQCNAAINAYLGAGGCTTDEVIYFNLLEAVGPDTGTRKIITEGFAMTSVPLPATAWLFGSGLIGIVAATRRRRIS